jgi:ParB/RepB/Spo0J family partition protein
MDTITTIALDNLHESPFNPRKIFDDTALRELATDIKSVGRVLQPLLVRPRIFAGGLARRGDGQRDPDDTQDGFEIVFGHRRYRAAALAGMADVPCMVRAITDDEARRAQISENLQRTDIHPIEEAEGYQALIDHDGQTADSIAEQFGKSRSHVYGRLKLLQACPEIRKACLAGEVGAEVALLVARLRTDKLQEKALGYIRADHRAKLDDGGKASFRTIRDLLVEKFTLDLKGAMFDVADEQLLPLAGSCVTCPKRSANAPEYADLAEGTTTRWGQHKPGSANACTDPDCFDAKKKAHLKREADKLASAGKVVVDGNAARNSISARGEIKGAYVALSDVQAALKQQYDKAKSAAEMVKAKPTVVLIQDPRTGKTHKAVKRTDVQAAGVKVTDAPAQGSAAATAAHEARRKAERAAEEAKVKIERQVRRAVLSGIRRQMDGRDLDAFDLQLVAQAAWRGVEWHERELMAELWGFKSEHELDKRIGQMDVELLTLFVMDCALVPDCTVETYSLNHKPTTLLHAAKHYGIDVDQVRTEVTKGACTPSTAARAADKAAPAARGVRYRCPDTGSTWSGKGLQPRWLKVALANGRTLAEFDVKTTAAKAASEQNDDAGVAGGCGVDAGAVDEAAA